MRHGVDSLPRVGATTTNLGHIIVAASLLVVLALATEIESFAHDYGRQNVYGVVDVADHAWSSAAAACSGSTHNGQPGVFDAPDTWLKRQLLLALAYRHYPTLSTNVTLVAVNAELRDGNWSYVRTGANFSNSSRSTCYANYTCHWSGEISAGPFSSATRLSLMIGNLGGNTAKYKNGDWWVVPHEAYGAEGLGQMLAFCQYPVASTEYGEELTTSNDGPTLLKSFQTGLSAGDFLFGGLGWAANTRQGLLHRTDTNNAGFYLYTPGDAAPVSIIGQFEDVVTGGEAIVRVDIGDACDDTLSITDPVYKYVGTDREKANVPVYDANGRFFYPNGRQVQSITFDPNNVEPPRWQVFAGASLCNANDYVAAALPQSRLTVNLGPINSLAISKSRGTIYLAGKGQVLETRIDSGSPDLRLYAGKVNSAQAISDHNYIGSKTGMDFDTVHTIVLDETEENLYGSLPADWNVLWVQDALNVGRTLYGMQTGSTQIYAGFDDFSPTEAYVTAMVMVNRLLVASQTESGFGGGPSSLIVMNVRAGTKWTINLGETTPVAFAASAYASGLAHWGPGGRLFIVTNDAKTWAFEAGGSWTVSITPAPTRTASTVSVSVSQLATPTRTESATISPAPSRSPTFSTTGAEVIPTLTRTASTVTLSSIPTASWTATAPRTRSATPSTMTLTADASATRTEPTRTASFPSTTPSVPPTPSHALTQTPTEVAPLATATVPPTESASRVATVSLAASSTAHRVSATLHRQSPTEHRVSPTSARTVPPPIPRTATRERTATQPLPRTATRRPTATGVATETVPVPEPPPLAVMPSLAKNADGDVAFSQSLLRLEKDGVAEAFLTLTLGGQWAAESRRRRMAERRFAAAAAAANGTLAPTGLLCAVDCNVVRLQPSGIVSGQVHGCNETHLTLALRPGSDLPPPTQASTSTRRTGSVTISAECVAGAPTDAADLTAPFELRDDREPPPRPLPKRVVQDTQTAAVAATVASTMVANPAIATQASRMSLILKMAYCEPEFEAPVFAEHPLSFSLQSVAVPDAGASSTESEEEAAEKAEALGLIVGSVVGNVAFIGICAAVQLLVSVVWFVVANRTGRKTRKTLLAAVSDTRFPGMLIVPLLSLLQAIVTSSVISIMHVGSGAATGIGAAGIAFCGLVTVGVAMVLTCFFRAERRDVTAEAGVETGTFAAKAKTFLFGTGKWVNDDSMREQRIPFTRLFGFLVVDYGERARCFMLFELLVSTLLGVAEGIQPDTHVACVAVAWTIAGLFVIYAATLLVLRPFCVAFHTAVFTPCACVQAAGSIFIAIFVTTRTSEWLLSVGSFVTIAAAYLLIAKEFIDAGMMLLEGGFRIYRKSAGKTGPAPSWAQFLDTRYLSPEDPDFDLEGGRKYGDDGVAGAPTQPVGVLAPGKAAGGEGRVGRRRNHSVFIARLDADDDLLDAVAKDPVQGDDEDHVNDEAQAADDFEAEAAAVGAYDPAAPPVVPIAEEDEDGAIDDDWDYVSAAAADDDVDDDDEFAALGRGGESLPPVAAPPRPMGMDRFEVGDAGRVAEGSRRNTVASSGHGDVASMMAHDRSGGGFDDADAMDVLGVRRRPPRSNSLAVGVTYMSSDGAQGRPPAAPPEDGAALKEGLIARGIARSNEARWADQRRAAGALHDDPAVPRVVTTDDWDDPLDGAFDPLSDPHPAAHDDVSAPLIVPVPGGDGLGGSDSSSGAALGVMADLIPPRRRRPLPAAPLAPDAYDLL